MNVNANRAKAAYMREWRRRNPERWKAIEERYWERKAAKEDIAEERKIEQSKK